MAVAWFRNPDLDPNAPVIDRHSVNERTFGISNASRHPAYVYSISKNAVLMHKIDHVEIHWYAIVGYDKLGRLKQPAMIARTVCGESRALTPHRTRTCAIPEPDSILCGACHGQVRPFGKHGWARKAGIKKSEAHVKLGCVVNGYPSSLENIPRPGGDQGVRTDASVSRTD